VAGIQLHVGSRAARSAWASPSSSWPRFQQQGPVGCPVGPNPAEIGFGIWIRHLAGRAAAAGAEIA
jgi:hypothetical protein